MATLTDMMTKLVSANIASSSGSGTLPVAPVSASMPNLKPYVPYPSRRDNEKCRDQANEQIEKFYEIFKEMSFEISFTDALILMPKFASTLKALIGNKEKLSEMARTTINEHCSTVILSKLSRKLGDSRKFLIPCEFFGMDECLALADLSTSINLMPLSVGEGLSLPELTPTCMMLKLTNYSVSKPIACEEYSQEVLGFSNVTASGIPTVQNDPIVFATSPTLTPFGDSDFLLFEEADAFLGLEDDPDSSKINPFYYDPKGDILLLKAILNSKPSPSLLNQEQNLPSSKVDVTAKLPHHTIVKCIRSFLGHAGFYRRFIQDFSKISQPMTHLLEKNTPFVVSEDCIQAFQTLKKKLTEAPILIAPNWDLPFELMCDASDFTIGAVLGQRHEKHFKPIHYASKTMNDAETNYTTIEKEMLAVVYAFEKFRLYLIMNKSTVHTDHSALKYLFVKKDAKARLLRWVLLLQEFDFKVLDTKGAKSLAADHLSRLENSYENMLDPKEINETFPLETLSMVTFRGDQCLVVYRFCKLPRG
nr:reverse transcriptase domain-containing protein [Tanacetum cinerariifolium]